ncbi:MAG: glycosyltransferase, partial [Actinobacteria bacterium]|nr:glycosyltransferase [Actinomycetota bacterium]
LVQHLRIVPSERIVIVPNAIELESPPPASVDLRAELGIDTETPLVGSVGRLVRQKAPEVFVRACARVAASVPQARFVLVGGGPLEGLVTSEIASAGLDDRFLLLRGFDEGERIMGQFDVFALPSRYEAGAAFAPMEAMRAGTPVVVTDVVGSRDAVEHGRSGFVVPPDDSAALADAVTRLLVDPALRRAFSDAGRRRVEERFDIRMAAVGIAEVYGSLARGEAERNR